MIASKSDKNSYSTVTSMLHTYDKEKHKTYDINDQLCIHSIRELIFMRENNDFLSVAKCNLMLEFFCTFFVLLLFLLFFQFSYSYCKM